MEKKLNKFFKKKTILITGGTGSFGNKAVETLLRFKPEKIIVFSRDELKQYDMSNRFPQKNLRFFLGDVRDLERLKFALKGVDYVIHAAALKHVPKAEYDPYEFVKTNIIGTQNIINAAISNNIEKVMLVSTDKAVSPVNLYGSTKLCAEKIIVSSNNTTGSENIKFSVSRYGNVINSRGSLIPNINDKIKNNQNLNLTHQDMTRFFITLEEGVLFTLKNFLRMQGGEIFIPKIKSYKISDILNFFAKKNNLKVNTIGIREGEKIHEVLISDEESKYTINFNDFYLIRPAVLLSQKKNYLISKLGEKGKRFKKNFLYSSKNASSLTNKDINYFLKESE